MKKFETKENGKSKVFLLALIVLTAMSAMLLPSCNKKRSSDFDVLPPGFVGDRFGGARACGYTEVLTTEFGCLPSCPDRFGYGIHPTTQVCSVPESNPLLLRGRAGNDLFASQTYVWTGQVRIKDSQASAYRTFLEEYGGGSICNPNQFIKWNPWILNCDKWDSLTTITLLTESFTSFPTFAYIEIGVYSESDWANNKLLQVQGQLNESVDESGGPTFEMRQTTPSSQYWTPGQLVIIGQGNLDQKFLDIEIFYRGQSIATARLGYAE